MARLIDINITDYKKIADLNLLIKAIWQEFFYLLYGKEITEYLLDFVCEETIKDELKYDNAKYYFIEKDGKNVGFVQLFCIENEIDISRCYLLKDKRGAKIGTCVFEKIKEIAIKSNINKISLHVSEDNINAIEIFEKWNFKKDAKVIRYIGNDYFLNEIKMIYEL